MQRNSTQKTVLVGNILAGVSLIISNAQLLPEGAFHESVRLPTLFLLAPSFMLWLSLFSLQYMGFLKIWGCMILGIVAMSFVIVFGLEG